MKPTEAIAYELKPGHKYLIVFDKRAISLNDASVLGKELKAMGCEAIAVGMATGVQDMKLVDLTATEEVKA